MSPTFEPKPREARSRLLDQPTRRRILDTIKANPGIKISHVCKETGAGWGTVKHHLHLLEKNGLVVSRSLGRDRLLFTADIPDAEQRAQEALRQGRAESLATAIATNPGASQKELCADVRMTRKIIRRYVELLTRAGLIKEQRENRFQRYYPSPELAQRLGLTQALPLEEAAAPLPHRDPVPLVDEPRPGLH